MGIFHFFFSSVSTSRYFYFWFFDFGMTVASIISIPDMIASHLKWRGAIMSAVRALFWPKFLFNFGPPWEIRCTLYLAIRDSLPWLSYNTQSLKSYALQGIQSYCITFLPLISVKHLYWSKNIWNIVKFLKIRYISLVALWWWQITIT